MKPAARDLKALFDLLTGDDRPLRAGCRWLIVGPELAAAILQDHARPPTATDLARLIRRLEERAPELLPVGWWLVDASPDAEEARAELQLDRLIDADIDAWEHPAQVIERPRADFAKLLAACVARRQGSRDDRQRHLQAVEAKLERTVGIEESARKRREKMRGRALSTPES